MAAEQKLVPKFLRLKKGATSDAVIVWSADEAGFLMGSRDSHVDLAVAEPIFHNFGGQQSFHGRIATHKVFEDNALVRTLLYADETGSTD